MKIETGGVYLGLNRSLQGLKRSGRGIGEAAMDIAASAAQTPVLSSEPSRTADPVSIRASAERPDLDDAIIDMKENHYGYRANLQMMKTSDEAFADLLDRVVPLRREGD